MLLGHTSALLTMTSTLASSTHASAFPSLAVGIADRAPIADSLTERSLRIWSAGAYDRVSAGFRHEAEAFVDRLQLGPTERVLDAACGSGNLTIPAARRSNQVKALDLVPSLIEQARLWAIREALPITFDVGNAELLPYADGEFDVVMSMFGVMFAARPDQVALELARVTRRGGRVALANWTRDGFVGQMLGVHGKFAPPPAGVPSPILWGDEQTVLERLPASDWNVQMTRRTLTFRYPHTGAGIAELFRGTYGPTVRTFEAIGEDQRAMLAEALTTSWVRQARAVEGGSEVDSTYLEVIATRR